MCQPTMKYQPGTWVWSKILNWIWWPGKIVDLSTTPEEFRDFVAEKKKNYVAVVFYDTDETHDVITNTNKLMEYNCPSKMEFIKKGYALLEREKKGTKVKGDVKMKNFVREVLLAEMATGGDKNIFEQISKEKEEELNKELNRQMIIKELFVTSKSASKKKKNERKSLVEASKTPNRKSGKSECSSLPVKRKTFGTPISNMFFCHGRCGIRKCMYSTNNYLLNIHIQAGTNKKGSSKVKRLKTNVQAKSSCKSNAKKLPRTRAARNSNKKEKTDSKSVKIEEMILDDWGEDDNDQDESFEINKNVVAETASTISTSNTIFDFDDDDDSASIENLRHMKNSSSLFENSESTLNKTNKVESSFEMSGKSESDPSITVDNKNKTILEDKNTETIVTEKHNTDHYLNQNDLKSSTEKVEDEEKTHTEDSTSMDMSSGGEEYRPTKSDHFNYLQQDNLPAPDWVKESSWDICASGYNKAISSALTLEDNKDFDFPPDIKDEPRECYMNNNLTESHLTNADPQPTKHYDSFKIAVYKKPLKPCLTDEELLQHPLFIKAIEKVELGQTENMYITIPGAVKLDD